MPPPYKYIGGEIATPNGIELIESVSDFPVAVDGVIKLEAKQYWIDGIVTISDEMEPPSTGVCSFIGVNVIASGIVYTGTGSMFKNLSFAAGFLINLECSFSAPNGQLYEITGDPAGFLAAFNCVFSDIDSLGILSGIGFSLVQSNIIDVGQGIIADNNAAATVGRLNWFLGKNQPGATFVTIQGAQGNVQMSANFFTAAGSNETVFDIKAASTIVAGIAIGNGINLTSGGTLFAPGSKDQTDIFWMYGANSGIENSKAIAGVLTNSNVAVTVTSASFQDMNLGTAIVSSSIERWKLNSTTTGELEYEGLEDRRLQLTASITAVKSGGGATITCDFRAFIDRGAGFVDLADVIDAPLEIKSTIDSKTLVVPVTVSTGDKIKILQRNNTNTDSIVVCNFSVVID